MQLNFTKPVGIIEGFYGHPWDHATRLEFPKLLAELGLNAYLYCPKSDPFLRKRWSEDWPINDWSNLMAFSRECHSRNIALGIGISPYEIYAARTGSQTIKLREKINKICELNPGFICILFDDMRGDTKDITAIQADIVNSVRLWSKGQKILFCPTYYSFDPILESVFGKKPIDYHQLLGEKLHKDIGILWTGEEVCSKRISNSHVKEVNKIFKRQITLWDNYAANDGRKRCKHLYLQPLTGRDDNLPKYVCGHLCNAMSQSELSLMTLSALSNLHGACSTTKIWLEKRYGKEILDMIMRDSSDFEKVGLDALSKSRLSELINEYSVSRSMATQQVVSWLKGRYRFDPNCLTE